MMARILPRYPVYVISKGRADCCLTAQCFVKDQVPFMLVVEPQESDAYAVRFGRDRLAVLPFANLGIGSIPARNWVWEHAKASRAERHWIIDDNIKTFYRIYKGKRMYCDAGLGLRVCEDFTDRYENIALSALNYVFFTGGTVNGANRRPFYLNVHVYSCILIRNDLSYRWRGRYNEDTDLSLQVLSGGWCTILLNTFAIGKMRTMTMKGGNTDQLYQGDGRLKMARALERAWPGVVQATRRFHRPQHWVDWKKFTIALKLKSEIASDVMPDEYGMELIEVAEVKSAHLRQLKAAFDKEVKCDS
jgi:hypothetical protein